MLNKMSRVLPLISCVVILAFSGSVAFADNKRTSPESLGRESITRPEPRFYQVHMIGAFEGLTHDEALALVNSIAKTQKRLEVVTTNESDHQDIALYEKGGFLTDRPIFSIDFRTGKNPGTYVGFPYPNQKI